MELSLFQERPAWVMKIPLVCSKTERLPSSKENCCRQPQIYPSTSHLAHHTQRMMSEFTPLRQLQRSIWRHRTPISHHPAPGTDTRHSGCRYCVHAQILNCISLGQLCCWELDRTDVWPWLGPAGSGRVAGGEGRRVWSNGRCNRTIIHDPQQMGLRGHPRPLRHKQ